MAQYKKVLKLDVKETAAVVTVAERMLDTLRQCNHQPTIADEFEQQLERVVAKIDYAPYERSR